MTPKCRVGQISSCFVLTFILMAGTPAVQNDRMQVAYATSLQIFILFLSFSLTVIRGGLYWPFSNQRSFHLERRSSRVK